MESRGGLVAALLLLAACGGTEGQAGTGGSNDPTGSGATGTSGASGTDHPAAGAGGVDPFDGNGGIGIGGMNEGGSVAIGGAGGNAGAGGAVVGPPPMCPTAAGEMCHEFFASDNGLNRLIYVNQFTSNNPGGVVWAVGVGDTTANSPRSIEIVTNPTAKAGPDGTHKALLVSLDKGFGEFDAVDGSKLVSVLTQVGQVTGAARLPDGNTALARSDVIRIVSPTGATVRQIVLPTGPELRTIHRDPMGNFWFAKTEYLYEINDQGLQLWKGYMGMGTKGDDVWWREGGGAFATTGDPSTIIEMDASGTIVSTVGGKGPMFPYLDFFTGFVRLPNGNYVVANWLGHVPLPSPDTPFIFEFAAPPQNAIVWQWPRNTVTPTNPGGNLGLARHITEVYVLR